MNKTEKQALIEELHTEFGKSPHAVLVDFRGLSVPAVTEFRRKIRVTNHSVRALLNLGSRLWTSGFYSVELLSHKLIRHFIALFLIALLISNAFLATRSRFFALMLLLQVLFYLLALGGAILRGTRAGRLKLFSIPYYFSLVNAAAFLGLLSIARKEKLRAWTPRGGLGKKDH